MSFSKILIANRGEIACRISRSARAQGYRTVAVYSEADANALHTDQADQAVCIGPPTVADSYLNSDAILAAARRTGTDAVHPGYGFLAENADFAKACQEAGLVFIGPDPEAIALMGNKAEAKRLMLEADVPCIPGYQGQDQSNDVLRAQALEIGFPLMVKAAAGGGGRGMRLVHDADALDQALVSARSEAANAFGSDELILEKAVQDARHVEIQVFADHQGNTLYLGERDCSVQRRHQKIVEEAPCPVVDESLRRRMGEAAVAAARAVNYRGAGTVEFLLDPDGAFYFLEMNTRLQVEHPVTEMVTGLDLVALQLEVAEGRSLGFTQEQVEIRGHAIEVRLYAEDPAAGFLPRTGRVTAWQLPEIDGVRIDHGLRQGMQISPYYDPMLAKIIAYGGDRAEALRKLRVAVEDTIFLGMESNREFLGQILAHPDFAAGRATTALIDTQFSQPAAVEPTDTVLAMAAAILHHRAMSSSTPRSLWNWHGSGTTASARLLAHKDKEHTVKLTAHGECRYGSGDGTILLLDDDGERILFELDGVRERAVAISNGAALDLQWRGCGWRFEDRTLAASAGEARAGEGILLAVMDGRIAAVNAEVEQPVSAGDTLVVLEAMKMEHQIRADVDGIIKTVHARIDDQVRARQVLVEIEVRAPVAQPS